MAEIHDLLRRIDQRVAEQIENREALRDAIAAILGEDPSIDLPIEWGNPVTLNQETRAKALRDLIENDIIQVSAFAGRNLEAMVDNVARNAFYAQHGVIPQTFMAGVKEEDLTEGQRQRLAEEMAKPSSRLKPTHRKNPDGSVTEIATGMTIGHVSGPPVEIKSYSSTWVEDYDAEQRKFGRLPEANVQPYVKMVDDAVKNLAGMYAVPPEHHP